MSSSLLRLYSRRNCFTAKSIVETILDFEMCTMEGSSTGKAMDLIPSSAAFCRQLIMHS